MPSGKHLVGTGFILSRNAMIPKRYNVIKAQDSKHTVDNYYNIIEVNYGNDQKTSKEYLENYS